MLPKETKFYIDDALYSSKCRRNLISFKDIRLDDYHVKTTNMQILVVLKYKACL
jgi:hypothetical protein